MMRAVLSDGTSIRPGSVIVVETNPYRTWGQKVRRVEDTFVEVEATVLDVHFSLAGDDSTLWVAEAAANVPVLGTDRCVDCMVEVTADNAHAKPAEELSTTGDRLSRIAAYKDKCIAAEDAKKRAEEMENYELSTKVCALRPRIEALILCANACIDAGIDLRGATSMHTDKFFTNGITHKVGFVRATPVTEMGIEAGGACGKLSFRTNGTKVYSSHEDERDVEFAPLSSNMKRFIGEFDEFEARFYKYVDETIAGKR